MREFSHKLIDKGVEGSRDPGAGPKNGARKDNCKIAQGVSPILVNRAPAEA